MFYKQNDTWTWQTNKLKYFRPKSRGMALGWLVVHLVPNDGGWLKSETGSKPLAHVLQHENEHIRRQRDYGVFKWIFKYLTDKKFKANEERIAKEAEGV